MKAGAAGSRNICCCHVRPGAPPPLPAAAPPPPPPPGGGGSDDGCPVRRCLLRLLGWLLDAGGAAALPRPCCWPPCCCPPCSMLALYSRSIGEWQAANECITLTATRLKRSASRAPAAAANQDTGLQQTRAGPNVSFCCSHLNHTLHTHTSAESQRCSPTRAALIGHDTGAGLLLPAACWSSSHRVLWHGDCRPLG